MSRYLAAVITLPPSGLTFRERSDAPGHRTHQRSPSRASACRGRPHFRSRAGRRHRAPRCPRLRQDHGPSSDARHRIGAGITYFRGRPLHRIPHPAREVGVLLGDVPGHPARTARGQLRMLCAAAGVPASRADELLETVGLAALRDQRIGAMSVGMDRRLGLAAALLGDPHALILDDPGEGLSPHEKSWLHGLLRAHAARGGTVLYTTRDPKEAARTADRVVTVDSGRLVADQGSAAFSRTRLRPASLSVPRTLPGSPRSSAVRRGRRSDPSRWSPKRAAVCRCTAAAARRSATRHSVTAYPFINWRTRSVTPARSPPALPGQGPRLVRSRRSPIRRPDRGPRHPHPRRNCRRRSDGVRPVARSNRCAMRCADSSVSEQRR